MFRIMIETTYDPPLTQEASDAATQRVAPCAKSYNIHRIRRFISQDKRFTLCELIASDADSVRAACRQANISFDRIWTATVLEPAPEVMAFSQIRANPTVHVLVEVTHHPPLAEEFLQSEIPDLHPYFESRHVRWVRSFVSRDRCRTICELEATDVGTVREVYRVAGYSIERVWVVDILESEPETVQASGVREPV